MERDHLRVGSRAFGASTINGRISCVGVEWSRATAVQVSRDVPAGPARRGALKRLASPRLPVLRSASATYLPSRSYQYVYLNLLHS